MNENATMKPHIREKLYNKKAKEDGYSESN
jgi:hypothetical protein